MAETTNPEGTVLRGGDVEVVKLELWSSQHKHKFDLSNIWKNISVYEDIETNYIRGEVTISDSKNILMDVPIITNEKLIVEFKTPSHPDSYKFVALVTEITNQVTIRQGMQVYVIRFVSPDFSRNQKFKFSKAYNDMLISDMVVDIYDNYIRDVSGKTINIVPTKDPWNRVIPTMSPFKSINWLCKWAKSESYPGGANYVFFENKHGFYFGPIEALIDASVYRKPAATYSKHNVHAQEDKNKDIKLGFYNIIEMKTFTPDVVDNITKGVYASKLLIHDPVLRAIGTSTFNYFDTYSDMTHLEKNTKTGGMGTTTLHNDTRLGAYSEAYIINTPDHYGAYRGVPKSLSDASNFVQARTSQLAQMGAIQLTITVPGDSNRVIGEVVEIKLPAVGTTTLEGREGEQDKYLSGRYLISAIRHEIKTVKEGEKDKYSLVMNVVKDSYNTPLPAQLITHWT